MSEGKTNIGDILGGVMGMATPMVTGLMKSMLTPERVKSMVGMLPKILGAVIDATSSIDMGELLSSIDMGELLSSTMGAILPLMMKLLDPLLDMLGPMIEGLLDMLTPVLEIVGPLLEAIGPLMESLKKIVGPMIGALTGSSA